MGDKPGVGILISGRGSNMEAILKLEQQGGLAGEVKLVISNRGSAKGLKTAESFGIPAIHLPARDMETFETEAIKALDEHGCTHVVLAGFMRVLTSRFASHFFGKCINIHPALLPGFPGLDGQGQALKAGVKVSGCTVHFVTPEVDMGPILLQKPVPVYFHDTEESLSRRILHFEHILLPHSLNLLLEDKVRLEGDRVFIENEERVHLEVWNWE